MVTTREMDTDTTRAGALSSVWHACYQARDWLWRGEALAQARALNTPLGAAARAQFDRARGALAAAELLRDRAPASDAVPTLDGPAIDALSLSLCREGTFWALSALAGGELRATLGGTFALFPRDRLLALAGGEAALAQVENALLARDFVASAALDALALRADARAARTFLAALLRELGAREQSEIALLRQRVLRVSASCALVVASLALVIIPLRRGPDLAEHAAWRASSLESGYPLSGRGGAAASETALFFHTAQESSPWLEFDLGHVQSVHRVRVVNRADCCWERAAPLALEVSADGRNFREVARRDELFYDWSTSFGSQDARYLRLRALKPTMLHLTRVEIR